jgi:hypothetical protein
MTSIAATQRQARRQLAGPRTVTASAIARTIGLLGIAAIAAFVFLVGLGVLHASQIGLAALDDYLTGDFGLRRVGVTAGSAAVGVIALALLRRGSSASAGVHAARHVVATSDRGAVFVNAESVCTLARLAVRQQPGVLGADVRVRGGGATPVRLLVRAAVMPGTALPVVGEASQVAARDAVERLAGLTVQDVHVELQIAAPDDLERVLE